MSDAPSACVIVIGDEILSGRTQDSNVAYIGRRCDEIGIRLRETRIIPDTENIIIETVNTCRSNFDYVFTTGGIGPTHDDITAASIAVAFKKKIERNPDAVAALDRYYESGQLTDARLKMADVPEDAELIDNPVSGAPGFRLENVYVLAGVPSIMQAMFEGLVAELTGGKPMLSVNVATNLGESMLASGLSEVQAAFSEVSIGSYPYFKQGQLGVNLVLRGTDTGLLESAAARVRALVEELGGKVLKS